VLLEKVVNMGKEEMARGEEGRGMSFS
jgi:hypothetical protein